MKLNKLLIDIWNLKKKTTYRAFKAKWPWWGQKDVSNFKNSITYSKTWSFF